MISKIKQALMGTGPRPTSESVAATESEVWEQRNATRTRLEALERERRTLLIVGSDEELATNASDTEAAKRQLEALEVRSAALSNRRRELVLLEAVDRMPARILVLREALADYDRAEQALDAAKAQLTAMAREVDTAWGGVMMGRPSDLQRLPEVPEGLRRRVHDVTGLCGKLPRPEPPERLPGGRAEMVGDREYVLEGRWTQAAINQFSQQQRPRSMVHGDTFELVGA